MLEKVLVTSPTVTLSIFSLLLRALTMLGDIMQALVPGAVVDSCSTGNSDVIAVEELSANPEDNKSDEPAGIVFAELEVLPSVLGPVTTEVGPTVEVSEVFPVTPAGIPPVELSVLLPNRFPTASVVVECNGVELESKSVQLVENNNCFDCSSVVATDNSWT